MFGTTTSRHAMVRVRSVFLTCLILVGVVASVSSKAFAQDAPVNSTLVGTWDGYGGEYADVWGDGDYAYVASFTLLDGMIARVHIVDISTPTSPALETTYFLPSPNEFRSPQDVKVAEGLLFIGLESGGTDLVEIVDVRDPANPVRLTSLQAPGFDRCHNTFYDNGFLYAVDSNTPRVLVYDLRTFDPDNPPAGPIDTPLWVIEDVGSVFVHDVTAKDGRLYAAGWDSGLFVSDISDVANTPPVFLGNVGGNNTHSMWPTDDGEYVVVGEERGGGGIQVYRMTDTGGSISFTETDSLVLSADAFSVHNQVVIGNRVYISWYQAGLQVFDINAISGELEFVASYDTSIFDGTASGFQGCWGTYPLLGEDKILLSDLENGLLVVSVQGPLVSFDYPDGFPSLSDPSGGTPVRVVVNAEAETPDPGSVTLFSRVDGGAFTGSPMPFDGAAFAGALPSAPCGSTIDYYVSVQTLEGSTITSPADAPASFQSVLSALGFVDIEVVDFESDPGWSVSGDATDGEWIRGTPLAECDRGNPIADFDGSGQCFLTDNILVVARTLATTTLTVVRRFLPRHRTTYPASRCLMSAMPVGSRTTLVPVLTKTSLSLRSATMAVRPGRSLKLSVRPVLKPVAAGLRQAFVLTTSLPSRTTCSSDSVRAT